MAEGVGCARTEATHNQYLPGGRSFPSLSSTPSKTDTRFAPLNMSPPRLAAAMTRHRFATLAIQILSILSIFHVIPASAQGTLSILKQDGFDAARWCVQQAFTPWDRGGLWNGALLCGKQNGVYLDSCVCRCNLRATAESFVSSYINSACDGNTIDIQSGLLMYNAYCMTAIPSSCDGYTPAAVTVIIPTTFPATLSIAAQNAMTGEGARDCVTQAFIYWDSNGLWNGALKCNKDGRGVFLNDCVCREDLLPLGESFISSFAKSACSGDTIDIQSGLSIYQGYCAGVTNMQLGIPAPTPGNPTGGGSPNSRATRSEFGCTSLTPFERVLT